MLNLLPILKCMIKLIRLGKKTPCIALSTGTTRFFLFRQGLFEIKIEESSIILIQKSLWLGENCYTISLNEITGFLPYRGLFCKGIRIMHQSRYLDDYIVIFLLTHEKQVQTDIDILVQKMMKRDS